MESLSLFSGLVQRLINDFLYKKAKFGFISCIMSKYIVHLSAEQIKNLGGLVMKKLITMVTLSSLVALSLTACGTEEVAPASSQTPSSTSTQQSESPSTVESSSTITTSDSKAKSEITETATFSGFTVTIQEASVVKDYKGNPAIMVTYEFKNDSDSAAAFFASVGNKAYQNGVECATATIKSDVMDSQPYMAKVQTGYSNIVKCAYSIKDTSAVTIEVGPLFDISGKGPVAKKTFEVTE